MKVLKFGGSSVGTAEALQQVKSIVEGRSGSVITVVSALGGVTDRLLEASAMAERGDDAYRTAFAAIAERHLGLIRQLAGLFPAPPCTKSPETCMNGTETADPCTKSPETCTNGSPEALLATIEGLLAALKTRLDGVYTLKVLPAKTQCEIVSYGERMSAAIVTALIAGARLYDALDFIRTMPRQGRQLLDTPAT